jgi:ankyrin repeat protein
MSGADVNIQNSDGQTVIHLLAFSHDSNLAKHICHSKNSIDMDMKDHDGLTPFMAAVTKGNIKSILYFLSLGHGPEKRMQKNKNPLHLAVELKNINVIKLLVKISHINLVDDSSHSALALAISHGNEVAVEILLLQDADKKQKGNSGNSMLHIACAGPSIHIARHTVAVCYLKIGTGLCKSTKRTLWVLKSLYREKKGASTE